MAIRGEIRWPLLGTFLAAYGEDLMAADTRDHERTERPPYHHMYQGTWARGPEVAEDPDPPVRERMGSLKGAIWTSLRRP
jgi:hypothetical protein